MALSPAKLQIGENDGFTKENDIFNLKPFGERLALIVEQNDEPAVIAIDGEWGSGKSVFAKQWAGLLRQRNTPVIEFDAFANDYHEDAFIALASEIIAYAKAVKTGEEDGIIRSFAAKAAKVGRALLPVAAKVIAKAATFGAVSQEDGRDIEQAFEAAASDAGAFIEKELYDRLNKAESTSAMMKSFGAALGELAAKLAQWEKPDAKAENVKPRLVVIIDELDRCKPSFALDLLEKIKHFYHVDGVSFVLVTNLRQIEAAVKGRYGAKTDAATYLQKFITVRFKWNPRNDADQPISVGYVDQCLKAIRPNLHNSHVEVIKFYCTKTNASLRTVEKIFSHIALYPDIIIEQSNNNLAFLGSIVLTFICLRESGIDLTKYNDKNKFKADALLTLNINQPLENLEKNIEKWIYAYIDFATIKNINQKEHQYLLNIIYGIPGSPDIDTLHRRIERLLNGEAVG